jgi:hypothetical protein
LYRGRLSTEPKRAIFLENNGARVSEEINEASTSETGEIEEDSATAQISQVNNEASTSGTCEIEEDSQA